MFIDLQTKYFIDHFLKKKKRSFLKNQNNHTVAAGLAILHQTIYTIHIPVRVKCYLPYLF